MVPLSSFATIERVIEPSSLLQFQQLNAVQLQGIGSMSCCYFANAPVHNMAEAMQSDRDRFGTYFHGMLEEGVYIAPSQFEAGFVSAAHDEAAIEKTVAAAGKVMKSL